MYEIFNAFCEDEFDSEASLRLRRLAGEIAGENRDYFLKIDHDSYIEHLVSKYAFDPLVLRFEETTVSDGEIEIAAEDFPPPSFVQPGRRYKRPVIRYQIPFSGDPELLRCKPNPSYVNTTRVFVAEGCLCFDLIVFYQKEPERVRNDAAQTISLIKQQYESLSKQVDSFNRGFSQTAAIAIDGRTQEIKQRSAFVAALGVPVRRREAPTLSVPITRKRVVIDRPAIPKTAQDPAVSQEMYEDILRLLHILGRTSERLQLYAGKDEEAVRDHLIPYLESHFELASTTGETFNMGGKTDILMRYEGANVFVGECKFWGGQKKHFDTINQALSYLSWRDSKAAIIYFVKNQALTATLKSVEADTPSHPQFIRFLGKPEETWFNYEFSLPQDSDRHIRLAVLCFHAPK